ncbi:MULTISPECIES: SDR family oxidoreductase [unclassified Mesorhizobium]|uniref:SDR family oxidoreductase n=1 Tax=unclassified Mesorhizobium TaxID=325217 RepID=UPI000FD20A21|nr:MULTISPECIES: SDR family oxidoreductase [unclassified Mesorhizobium]RVB80592.1 SDR family oxidoreductase [Mesorhizobium sp. M6A.T.Cr.TU.014.01.1.1]RWQ06448.1 MAG: SDR family oxidoreductase [Mesorhizobium sp.]RWQ10822.1 MAG: SDR family oxidoreductase [Mesorhizobium sp.]
MKLEGKTAVITGAGRGIGRATAHALAREGANIVLAAPEVDQIEAVAAEIRAIGREALAVETDIQHKSQVMALAQAAFERFGAVDILVNNAGVAIHNAIPNIKEEDWDWMMAINLKGTFLCTQAFFQHMCERKSGHIVNIVSRAGKVASAKFGAYGASKFGMLGFTQTTDAEGVEFGVKATALCPGAVDTQQRAENHIDDHSKLLLPEDVADCVAFIVTRPARVYIGEASPVPQFMKPMPNTNNLKPGV